MSANDAAVTVEAQPAEPIAKPAQLWWRTVSAHQWYVFAIVSAAWFFDNLDQRLFSLTRVVALSSLMNLPTVNLEVQAAAKVATAIFLLGWGIGGLTFGALGDRYGRARILTISITLYAIGSALTALSRTHVEFVVLRMFTGIGIGGVFGLAVAILSETVSGTARVAMLALLQVLSTAGNMAAAVIKIGIDSLAQSNALGSIESWRVLFMIGALPIFLAVVSAVSLRESETWLRLKAMGALPRGAFGSYAELFRSRDERRNLVVGTALAASGVVGLWAIGEFAVDLQDAVFTMHFAQTQSAASVSYSVAQAKNLAYLLQMTGGALGMLAFGYVANRAGRRVAFMSGFTAALVVTLLVYWKLSSPRDAYWMMPLMGAAQLSVFAGFAIYLPELFGARTRGTAVSFAYNFGRFAAVAGGFASALLTTRVFDGFAAPAPLRYSAMLMCSIFVIGIVASWAAPETLGKELRD